MTQESRFIEAIDQHRGILFKVARLYFRDPDDQEDLVQEILFQLWRSYDSFAGKSQFSTWMYRVAINTAIVFVRKESRRSKEVTLSDANIASASNDTDRNSELGTFYLAIGKLTRIEKAIILMHIEGFSHKHVAETLGISEGNARVKLNRIKKKLQSIVKDMGADHEI